MHHNLSAQTVKNIQHDCQQRLTPNPEKCTKKIHQTNNNLSPILEPLKKQSQTLGSPNKPSSSPNHPNPFPRPITPIKTAPF